MMFLCVHTIHIGTEDEKIIESTTKSVKVWIVTHQHKQKVITPKTKFKCGVDLYIKSYDCRCPHYTLRNQTPCQSEEKAMNCKA